jgi:hypothetical protein
MSLTKTTSINWAVISSQTRANRDLGIFTTNVSQINMAYIPILFIFLMENADSTCIYIYVYSSVADLGIYFEEF